MQRASSRQHLQETNNEREFERVSLSGEDEVTRSPVASTASARNLSPEKGVGQIQEGNVGALACLVDGDLGVVEHGDRHLQREPQARGPGETPPQRQFEVWDVLRELDFYHLTLCMVLTSMAGLFIVGA